MPQFQGEPDGRRSVALSRQLWTALHALDGYLTGQSAHLVDYAERRRAGQRVGTALTEGTANFLVNRRMARRSRCAGPGAGPIGCSRSAAPSTTARSAPVSGRNSCRPTTHTRQWRWPPDPQLCDGPVPTQARIVHRPAGDPVSLLRNAMPVVAVDFERHGRRPSTIEGSPHPAYPRRSIQATRATTWNTRRRKQALVIH